MFSPPQTTENTSQQALDADAEFAAAMQRELDAGNDPGPSSSSGSSSSGMSERGNTTVASSSKPASTGGSRSKSSRREKEKEIRGEVLQSLTFSASILKEMIVASESVEVFTEEEFCFIAEEVVAVFDSVQTKITETVEDCFVRFPEVTARIECTN